jgi:hypothetical protein
MARSRIHYLEEGSVGGYTAGALSGDVIIL